jgi:hypothetical protein
VIGVDGAFGDAVTEVLTPHIAVAIGAFDPGRPVTSQLARCRVLGVSIQTSKDPQTSCLQIS